MIEFVKSVFRFAIKFIGISLIYLSNSYNPALFCKLMQQWPSSWYLWYKWKPLWKKEKLWIGGSKPRINNEKSWNSNSLLLLRVFLFPRKNPYIYMPSSPFSIICIYSIWIPIIPPALIHLKCIGINFFSWLFSL